MNPIEVLGGDVDEATTCDLVHANRAPRPSAKADTTPPVRPGAPPSLEGRIYRKPGVFSYRFAMAGGTAYLSIRPMPVREFRLRLRVFFREKRPGVWIAQAVDHDLNAQGKSLEHARYAFAMTVIGQATADIDAGLEPLEALGPPPPGALEDFERGWELTGPRELTLPPGVLPPPWIIKAELAESRVYSA